MMARTSVQEGVSQRIVDDTAAMLRFMGHEGTVEEWLAKAPEERREGHEKIARAFEAYLYEGRAPVPELQSLFQKMRRFLMSVYSSIKGMDVELTDEVRSTFDRMLATDEQLGQAQEAYAPLWDTAEEAGMTEGEFARYQKANSDAVLRAEEDAVRMVMADIKRLKNADRKKTRDEVEAEVMKNPAHQARHYLTKGYMWGDEAPDDAAPIKLSRDALTELYGDEAWRFWRDLGNWYISKTGDETAANPDAVADLFGYESGEEMIRAMTEAGHTGNEIKRRTKQVMDELYSDLNTPEKIVDAAQDAVHNGRRVEFLNIELKALGKKAGKVVTPWQAAKAAATQIIGRKGVKEVKPWFYLRAERKAADEALKAAGGKKFDKALEHKQAQMLNHALYLEAKRIDAEFGKMRRLVKSLGQKGSRKNIDREFLKEIDDVLASLPEDLRDLGVDEMVANYELLKSLAHRGRNERKVEMAGKARDLEEVKAEMKKTAGENWKPSTPDYEKPIRVPVRDAGRWKDRWGMAYRVFP
jgi:hypothetical protein